MPSYPGVFPESRLVVLLVRKILPVTRGSNGTDKIDKIRINPSVLSLIELHELSFNVGCEQKYT